MAKSKTITHQIATSLVYASAGAALGFGLAHLVLPDHLLETSLYPKFYAVGGAVVGVLFYRLGTILLMIFDSYRRR